MREGKQWRPELSAREGMQWQPELSVREGRQWQPELSVREGQAVAAGGANARSDASANVVSYSAGGRPCEKGETVRANVISYRAGASSCVREGRAVAANAVVTQRDEKRR